ncbi:3,4-dihydroxy-2-butanone 4-phosphate synthase [Hyphomicrobium sulfonivorans]|uniref:GTP cyclohydrolase II n=2 Tax=Hyphomicrobium sulfonivorans TaxID=121290 RepID=A0A125NW02_HYPSL|nr:3,4-dihydroxy-2-butanone 4-phosphate synthase [Hyphomicrobium sulfonivorans]
MTVQVNVMASIADAPALEVVETALPIAVDGREQMFRAYAFQGAKEEEQLLVLVHGDASAGQALPLVRLHSGCVTGDIFHSMRCDCYEQLQASLKAVLESSHGAIVYMPYHEGRGIGLFKKMRAYALQERGVDTVDANTAIGAPVDARDFGLAAKALAYLGLNEIRLLCNNPAKVEALAGFGITIAERISVASKPNRHNERYLNTKRDRMGHQI